MTRAYDVIVVGGGPAGSTAARRLALAGRQTLLLERARYPRPKACGGGLTGRVEPFLGIPLDGVVENHITEINFSFRGTRHVRVKPPGLSVAMVHRDRFDELLARQAVASGAELREESPLRSLTDGDGRWTVRTPQGDFTAPVVIGADGAASPTARAIGLRQNARLGIALDADLETPAEDFAGWKQCSIFEFGMVPRGYGWSFPKNGSVTSIGVGTIDNRMPAARRHLQEFIARHESLRRGRVLRQRAAPIPYWTGLEPLARSGVFLAGDAAGLVDPLSGEGISYAVRSGILAAQYAEARLDGDRKAEDGYTDEIGRTLGRNFEYALRLTRVFFRHPSLSFTLGVRSRRVNRLFVRLIAGEIDYCALHLALADSLPGRLYHLLRPFADRLAS